MQAYESELLVKCFFNVFREAAQAELKNKTHHLQNLQQQYASLSELVEANEAKNKTNDQVLLLFRNKPL